MTVSALQATRAIAGVTILATARAGKQAAAFRPAIKQRAKTALMAAKRLNKAAARCLASQLG